MAFDIVTCANPDQYAGANRANLVLALSDSLLRTNALVLVWFYATAHSVYFVSNNDTAVSRVRVAIFPYL